MVGTGYEQRKAGERSQRTVTRAYNWDLWDRSRQRVQLRKRRETGSLNCVRLLLVDRLDEANELLARLIGHLLIDARVENVREDLEQGVDVGHERGAVRPEEMEDLAEGDEDEEESEEDEDVGDREEQRDRWSVRVLAAVAFARAGEVEEALETVQAGKNKVWLEA